MSKDFEEIPVTGDKHKEAVHNFIVGQLLEMHSAKDAKQGDAWAKRGFSGFWYFVANYWDRLEVMFARYFDSGREKKHVIDVDLFDALIDVAMYAIKFATVLAQLDSSLTPRWRQRWQESLPLIEGSITMAGSLPPALDDELEQDDKKLGEGEVWGKPTDEDGLLEVNL